MKKILSFLLTCALTTSPLWADSGPEPQQVESIKKKVAECVDHQRRVVVETYDHRRLQGMISEARENDFVVSLGGRATTLSYADVNRIKWPSPVWRQVKIFAAAAAVTAAIFGAVVLLGGLKG